jgi:hypothetical protein
LNVRDLIIFSKSKVENKKEYFFIDERGKKELIFSDIILRLAF